jgi:nitrite reductase/ring-hydroxylating ferredoxin subunit
MNGGLRKLEIPAVPQAWYYVCGSHELKAGATKPKGFKVASNEFVAYRVSTGEPVVLSGRCCHFGASLATGTIIDDCVACAFHGWRFGSDGKCRFIPAGDPIPPWARQRRYPVKERYGQVFFYLGEGPQFDLPSFEDVDEQELIGCSPNFFHLKVPWYLGSANGFDMQHFKSGHERQHIAPPHMELVGEDGIRITVELQNVGTSILDRLAALIAGTTITLSVFTIGGNSLAVTSSVKRTKTYGFVNFIPVSEKECFMVNVVMVRRKRGIMHRLILNWVNAWIRREFIRRFLACEAPQLNGTDVILDHCQPSDTELRRFLEWLSCLHGTTAWRTNGR